MTERDSTTGYGDLIRKKALSLTGDLTWRATMLEEAAALIIRALDEDPTREGLVDTPRRFKDMFLDDFSRNGSAQEALSQMVMEETFDQMIIVRDVPVRSHCEHHILPWVGKVCIAYIPKEKTAGLSKITRMVEAAARGLTIQERVTERLADAMVEVLEPLGVMVVIEAKHLCTMIRGVRAENQKFTTSKAKGVFLTKDAARLEFLALWSRGDVTL